MIMDYEKLTEELKKRGSVPGLDAIRRLLFALGDPQDEIPVVHIAGTNGKGSVFACLSSILIEAGYKVGRYVSPTITCYEERFQINGAYIKRERLERLYVLVEEALKRAEKAGVTPTLFEVETALAFLYFKEEKVDFALIETGMGGLLDATNVVSTPLLCVISSISYDHQAFLGETLSEIAAQKAGIIKEGCSVVLAENLPEAAKVVRLEAQKKKAACMEICAKDYQVIEEMPFGSRFSWKKTEFSLALPGRHQIANAVTALAASELLLEEMDETKRREAQQAGLSKARWPGRLELLRKSPLFYRDGAHNPDGARKLADFLQKHFTNKKIIYIMGVLKDKEYKKMLAALLPLAQKVYVFTPENERGLSADILAAAVREMHIPVTVCADVNAAARQALSEAAREDVLVACGSLSFMEAMEEY